MAGKVRAKELVFQKLEDPNTPNLTCNMCGVKRPGYGMRACDVVIAKDATFMVVLCSKRCEKEFKGNPESDKYLRDRIAEMQGIHNQGLN